MDVVIEDINIVCRLCAAEIPLGDANDVFISKILPTCRPLTCLIQQYLNIHIEPQDHLSSVVCDGCRHKVVTFDEFALNCNKVQESFKCLVNRKLAVNGSSILPLKIEKDEDKLQYVEVKIKEEEDKLSVKSENFSDGFAEDDSTPIAELAKKKSKKRSSRSDKSLKEKGKKLGSKSLIARSKKSKRDSENNENKVKKELENSENVVKKEKIPRKPCIPITSSNSFFNFVCHVCSESFPQWFTLKNHCLKVHDTKPKVKCICEKYLFTQQAVRNHLAKHDASRGHKCEICDKVYSSRKTLEVHAFVHKSREEYPHICSQCPKRFPTSSALKVHERTHIPREDRCIHSCEICGLKFVSAGILRSHVNAVHEKLRPVVCDVCGLAFSSKGNLRDHRLIHGTEKKYACTKCPKRFKTRASLRRHIDCHGDKKYKCSECSAILNTRKNLRVHMIIHEDICRYVCAFCNKAYKRRKALKSHLNLHTGERPYSCPWCSRTFADNSNCRIHKRRMHPVELAEYEAIHGPNYEIVKDDKDVEQVIHSASFKKSDDSIVIMPDIADLIQHSQAKPLDS